MNLKDKKLDIIYISILVLFIIIFFRKIIAGQTYFWFDFILGNFPRRAYMAETLSNGNIPLWIPYIYGGYPFAGSNPSHFLYPFTAILALFVKNGRLTSYVVEISIIMQVCIGGIAMYFLLKEMGISKLSSLFGAVIFSLSLPIIVRTQHTSELCGLIWVPLIFYSILKTLKNESLFIASLTGLIIGVCILGAHPQFYFYLILVIIAFLLYNLLTSENKKHIFIISSIILIVSFLISAVRLLPEIQYVMLSSRISKEVIGNAPIKTIFALFLPHVFGKGMGIHDYWGGYKGFWMFVEYSSYIGVISLFVLALSFYIFKKKKIRFYFYLLLFSLLFMYGSSNPIHKVISFFFPGLRMHIRFMPFFVFSAAVICSFSLENIMDRLRETRRDVLIRVCFSILILSIILFITNEVIRGSYSYGSGFDSYKYGVIFGSYRQILIFLFLSSLILLVMLKSKLSKRWLKLSIILVLFLDLYIAGSYFTGKNLKPENYYSNNNLIRYLKYENDREKIRIDCPRFGYFYANSRALIHRIESLEGHVANKLFLFNNFENEFKDRKERYLDLYNVKFELIDTVIQERRTIYPKLRDTYMKRAWVVHKAIKLPDSLIIPYMKSQNYRPEDVVILSETQEVPFENVKNPKKKDSLNIEKYEAQMIEISVDMKNSGYLVLSENYYPGWSAMVDGKKVDVIRGNYLFRVIPLNKGKHRVVLKFYPGIFKTGIILLTIGVIFIFCLGFSRRLSFLKKSKD